MGIGYISFTRKPLNTNKIDQGNPGLSEISEAFTAQIFADEREMKCDTQKRNIRGGENALGHPIECTGTKIIATLLHSLIEEDKELGLATLCMSGGQGMSQLLKRI